MMKDHSELLQRIMLDHKLSRRDFMRMSLATGITMSTATSLWSQSAAAADPVKGGHFVQSIEGSSATSSLDPTTYTNQYESGLGYAFGQRLLGTDPVTSEYVPELATSVETSDGGTTWVFKLRKGVTFHNGKELTPADVAYSLQRHYGKDSKSGAAGSLSELEAVTASAPGEVTIKLKSPNADLPFFMTDYHLLIQPEGSTNDGIGTGAYKLKENRPGEGATLERYAGYWDDKSAWFDSIEFLAINDATARTTALMTGKAHLITRVDPKTTDLLKKNQKLVIENTSGRGHYVFVMHCNTAPFDNNDLRMALKHAIDRKELVDKVLRGYGQVGNDIPINAAYPYFSDDIPQHEYDPEKAASYYKKSGHSGPILLQVSNAAFSGAEDAAVLFQQHAEKAGIKLDVKREPSDGYWDNIWNVKPFCASYWSGRPTQDQMYAVAYKSDAAWNDTRFKNEKFDKLLLEARSELDTAKRKNLYREMGLLVHDEGGLIMPMFNDFIDARAANLMGYVRDGQGAASNGMAPYRCWFGA